MANRRSLTPSVNCLASSAFFFSSRRRHTRCSRDWSSDVRSSDLYNKSLLYLVHHGLEPERGSPILGLEVSLRGDPALVALFGLRSEERRVGKECRSRWSPFHDKKNDQGISWRVRRTKAGQTV